MTVFRMILLAVLLTGCAKEFTEEPEIAKNETAPIGGTGGTSLIDCTIDTWEQSIEQCASVRKNGVLLSESRITGSGLEFTASKKNGGSGGTRWFDANLLLSNARNLQLPTEIPATGNAGNGQKLYVKFNDSIDCAWYSHANTKYRNPRCFTGATRAPGNSAGFSGGTEIGATQVTGVTKVWVQVNGSSGSGVVTTINASFLYL